MVFIESLYEEKNVAPFSHYLAHLALSLQIAGERPSGFEKLVRHARSLPIAATV